MAKLQHVCLGVQNLYEAAHRLRDETGLDSYEGGWFKAGMAMRVVPVGNDHYIEVESLIDPRMAEVNKGAPYYLDFTDYLQRATENGDALIGCCLRTESLEELREVGRRLDFEVSDKPLGARIRPDGSQVAVYAGPPSARTWPKGLPNYLYYPSGERPGAAEVSHRGVTPRGIAWLELGGDEQELRAWLGSDADEMPLRFAGGEPGIRAVGIATDDGEIVIRP